MGGHLLNRKAQTGGLAAKALGPDAQLVDGVEKSMIHKEDVPELVKSRDFDVLVILGAGDLDNYVPEITKIIESKK